MKRNSFALAVGFLFCFSIAPAVYSQSDGKIEIKKGYQSNLTLKQAIVKTLNFSPELSALSLEKRAREARTLQSGLLPNPTVNVYTEDIAGSGPFEGFKQSETTIQLGTLIELGSKRSARVKANRLSEKMADWDYETKRLELLTKVSKSFLDVLKAQHKVSLTQKLMTVAKQAHDIVSEKVKAGKAASIEKVKAKIALSSIKIELNGSRLELDNARLRMASFWGSAQPQFSKAVGDFFKVSPIPSSESFLEKLSKNPNLARWSTELKRRQAALDSEKANGVPNIQVNGGYRHLETTNDDTLRFGVTIPIQIFNRNQGAIAEAKNRLEKTREEKRAMQLNTTQEFFKAYNTLVFSHSQVVSIKNEILPEAQKAFEATQEGYRFGKFGLREVLESQRTWFEAQRQYVEALARYHKANIDVEALTGSILIYKPPINSKSERKARQ